MSNFDAYKGTMPYASEMFGLYQPLIGWKSEQKQSRIDKERSESIKGLLESMLKDSRFRKYINKKPVVIGPGTPVDPRPPAWMDTLVVGNVLEDVTKITRNEGRSPTKSEWQSLLSLENLQKALDVSTLYQSTSNTETKRIEALNLEFYPKTMLSREEFEAIHAHPIEGTDLMVARKAVGESNHSVLREAIMAGTLNWLSQNAPHLLNRIFERKRRWEMSRNFIDPLSDFDPQATLAVLSPIGLVHLYREYFFEFETFLGPPVGHVWISPGGTVELIEVNTRRTVTERTMEAVTETTTKSELAITEQDEISDAIKEENQQNTRFGITSSGGWHCAVAHAEASANFGIESTHKEAEEMTHKHMRQQSEKLSTEIRRNFKTTFRTMTEVQDTASRRYVLQNNTDKLINYELRRKMRRISVQVQHVGTQLCWQIYVDDPGKYLGVAELVHMAKPEDIGSSIQPPEAPPTLDAKESEFTIDFPYQAIGESSDTDERFHRGDDGEGDKIRWQHSYNAVPPATGYNLNSIRLNSIERVDPGEDYPEVTPTFHVTDKDKGTFLIVLDWVNFHDQPAIKFVLNLTWDPPDQKAVLEEFNKKLATYKEQQRREAYEKYVTAVRERIKAASSVQLRKSEELREEERIVVYRRLIEQLLRGVNQEKHITTELIRALFDVDNMLYFVAPEWWQPREHSKQQVTQPIDTGPDINTTLTLTEENRVGWGGVSETGRDNYLITEESSPARMGSSLGWLLQLDGDNHRNAFLNSPWVKAVIPIRPGREAAALNWLKNAHVEGTEGLDAKYGGPESELQNKTIEQALDVMSKNITEMNSKMENALSTEAVFEKGFDPLEEGFRATGKPYEIFDQWIEVLPTDQVVAVEYDASKHI
jgi:hypothetical protein